MPNDPAKKPLGFNDRFIFGVVLPWCAFGLFILCVVLISQGGDAAYGFALLGFLMATGVVTAIGFILSLLVVSIINWKSRATLFIVGCVVPIIAVVVLLAGAPK